MEERTVTAVPEKPGRIFALDGIRCLATLSILTFHFNLLTAELGAAKPVGFLTFANGSMGHFGVPLFFILSGYSLHLRWAGRFAWKPYLKSRFLSILPVYWLGFSVLFLYTDMLHGALNPDIPLGNLAFTVLGMDGYLAGVVPTFYKIGEWFVGCILLLYLCFPLLEKALEKRPLLLGIGVLVLFLPWVYYGRPLVAMEHCFVTRIPEFLLGMYLAKYRGPLCLERWGWLGFFPLAVLWAVPLGWPEPILTLLVGASAFPAVYWLCSLVKNRRVCRLAQTLAGYSYAVFLVHHVTLDILFRPRLTGVQCTMPQILGVWGLYLAVVLVLGVGLFYADRWLRALPQKLRTAKSAA